MYVIAGDPTLAQMYLNWLVAADEGHAMEDYCFPRKLIQLEGHMSSNKMIEVDTCECLQYLTKRSDPKKILDDLLIRKTMDLLWQMVSAEVSVNPFDLSTWPRGVDLNPAHDMIHEMIAPHIAKIKQLESYVQVHAFVANTNMKQVGEPARYMLHSMIVQPFN